jgi:glycosyltransferase involved in cell wall biosynthesis
MARAGIGGTVPARQSCQGDAVRVLHVIKGLGPGGAERLLVSLTSARGAGTAVDVAYLLHHKGHLVPELEAAGGTAHLLSGTRGLADPRWPTRLVALVRRTEPDIVHLHSPAVAALARPLLRARRSRPVLVSTEHNQWGSFGRATRLANAVTLPLDDVRLAVSDQVRDSAWPRWRGRTEVLIHGIPVEALAARRAERTEARAELGLGTDDVVVAHVANLREKKDHATLLAAARQALDAEPHLRFISIGQGPLEDEIRARHAELGLGDRFTLLGYHPDPARILAAADLFTLTSRHEGLPIALLEALALGLPAVVSAVGGIPSVVRPDIEGVLLDAGDVDGFAQAYLDLAHDPERRSALGKGAALRAGDYDIVRTQAWLEDRYATALRSRDRQK